ncbi:MAG: glycosyltransferase family 2 protein [Desulfobacterales bacterium]|nr:glycosyltransferase family 2 protein [Desulfobacterales bacterium]
MFRGKKVIIVMPAYNAALTLRKTYDEVMTQGIVDLIVVVDDGSRDETVSIAKKLPNAMVYIHERNQGYGANQKTCYKLALEESGDIIIMVHPDYQYTPKLITAMASMIVFDVYDVVLGSRIISGGALKGGMPVYKYIANRFLTAAENLLLGSKLSEFHTGYRAFHRKVLENIPFHVNSDDFVFDNEILAQVIYFGHRIGEVSCPAKYFEEASSISFRKSVLYGLGVLRTAFKFRLQRFGLINSRLFSIKERCIDSVSNKET